MNLNSDWFKYSTKTGSQIYTKKKTEIKSKKLEVIFVMEEKVCKRLESPNGREYKTLIGQSAKKKRVYIKLCLECL